MRMGAGVLGPHEDTGKPSANVREVSPRRSGGPRRYVQPKREVDPWAVALGAKVAAVKTPADKDQLHSLAGVRSRLHIGASQQELHALYNAKVEEQRRARNDALPRRDMWDAELALDSLTSRERSELLARDVTF